MKNSPESRVSQPEQRRTSAALLFDIAPTWSGKQTRAHDSIQLRRSDEGTCDWLPLGDIRPTIRDHEIVGGVCPKDVRTHVDAAQDNQRRS
jgi:hypothetical protein